MQTCWAKSTWRTDLRRLWVCPSRKRKTERAWIDSFKELGLLQWPAQSHNSHKFWWFIGILLMLDHCTASKNRTFWSTCDLAQWSQFWRGAEGPEMDPTLTSWDQNLMLRFKFKFRVCTLNCGITLPTQPTVHWSAFWHRGQHQNTEEERYRILGVCWHCLRPSTYMMKQAARVSHWWWETGSWWVFRTWIILQSYNRLVHWSVSDQWVLTQALK